MAKHWLGGDKCLAAIHLAQMGLPDIGNVRSLTPQIAQAGPVHITFIYRGANPSLD